MGLPCVDGRRQLISGGANRLQSGRAAKRNSDRMDVHAERQDRREPDQASTIETIAKGASE